MKSPNDHVTGTGNIGESTHRYQHVLDEFHIPIKLDEHPLKGEMIQVLNIIEELHSKELRSTRKWEGGVGTDNIIFLATFAQLAKDHLSQQDITGALRGMVQALQDGKSIEELVGLTSRIEVVAFGRGKSALPHPHAEYSLPLNYPGIREKSYLVVNTPEEGLDIPTGKTLRQLIAEAAEVVGHPPGEHLTNLLEEERQLTLAAITQKS